MDQPKTMQKRKNIFIVLSLGLLMILLATTYFYLRYQERLAQRHHLLCEVLKPGMSKDEVISLLNQAGNFTIRQAEWSSGDFALDIIFTDLNVKQRYGGFFSVVFFDYKYARAVVSHGSDNPEYICDFYQATQSVTETP